MATSAEKSLSRPTTEWYIPPPRRGSAKSALAAPAHRHPGDQQRGAADAALEPEVVADRLDAAQHVERAPGHRHALDRKRLLAVLDPEPLGLERVVTGHRVEAVAALVVHVEPALDAREDRLGALAPGLDEQVVVADAAGAHRVAGRAHAAAARPVAVVLDHREPPALDEHVAPRRHSLAVPQRGADPAAEAAVVHQRHERRGDHLIEPAG